MLCQPNFLAWRMCIEQVHSPKLRLLHDCREPIHPRNPNTPPKLVTWGEGSTDEMSGLLIGGVTANPGWDEGVMWLTMIGHYFDIDGKAIQAREKRLKP